MRLRDKPALQQLCERMEAFSRDVRPLPGVSDSGYRESLAWQIVDSIRRVQYVREIANHDISPRRADSHDDLFDPLKAALIHERAGDADEAFWMVFLAVHFGKNLRTKWRLPRDVHGSLGGVPWTWARVSVDPSGFRSWLHMSRATLQSGTVPRHFGNHRKYESLDAYSATGTGSAVESYVQWIGRRGSHQATVHAALSGCNGDRRKAFSALYDEMGCVVRFGRTARFDYLTMLGKLGLAEIEPGSTYMDGATGPKRGAMLLFGVPKGSNIRTKTLDSWAVQFGDHLGIGMQEVEDSLCNWQKSPSVYKPFRG